MADGSAARIENRSESQPLPGLRRAPRQSLDFTNEDRDLIVADIIGRLFRGIPLAEICRTPGMPDPVTIARWETADADLASAIARARAHGSDCIAADALLIIDGKLPLPGQAPDVQRDKLRFEGRLRLLAKWDPKRYGEAVQMRMADANGEKLDTTPMIRELLALVRPADGSQAVVVEGTAVTKKEPPAG